MNILDRICTGEREEWGDAPRECVLALNIVGKALGVKFGYFFLEGGDLPVVVCTWAGGPQVSAVYDAVREDVMTDLPVLLRRHAEAGDLKALEQAGGEVQAVWALNPEAAADTDETGGVLSQPLGAATGISGILTPEEAAPSKPVEQPEPEFTEEDLRRGVQTFLHYLLGGEAGHDRSATSEAVEKIYEMLPESAMNNLCQRVVHSLSQAHKYAFGKLKVGLAVLPSQVTGLPQEIYDNLWEGDASPILLVSWQAGPEFGEVVETCRRRVDAGGLPLLLYRYAKGEPAEVDPISILRSGQSHGEYAILHGAQN